MSGQAIDFGVLGPTEAWRDGEAVALSGARRRALLARLLLDAGRVVPLNTLVDDVWGADVPSAAAATLQSHLSQLRKVLGDCLRWRSGGYVLSLTDATFDVETFERHLDAACAHLAGRDGAAAATLLRTGLGLWRGRALQDVEDRPWAAAEAARLEELRRVAREQLICARLAAGADEQVVADAEASVAEEPLREQRWAILMLAMYRCGRQAAALRAFHRLRTRLADELGIDPSPQLMDLEAAILRQDPALRPPAQPAVIDVGDALARTRDGVAGRDWRTVCELLRAVDGVAPLDAELLELLGDAAFMLGEQHVSIAARQRAHTCWLESGNRTRAGLAAMLIVGNHYVRNRPAIACGWFHKGRRLIEGEPEGPAHGVLAYTGALIALARGEPESAAHAAAQARRIGARFAQPDIESLGLALLGCAMTRTGRLQEAQSLLEEALAWATSGQLGPIATGQIFCWSTQAWIAVADFERAAEWIEAIEASGVGGFPGDCRVHRAEVLHALGRREHAQTELLEAQAEIRAIDLLHVATTHYEIAMIHLVNGKLEAAERAFRHSAACGAPSQPGRALLQLARGDAAGAAASMRAALDDPCLDDLRRARLLTAAVPIAFAAGRESDASAWAADLDAIADRIRSQGLLALARDARSTLSAPSPVHPPVTAITTEMREYSTAQHEALAEAILSGDAERAESTMRPHLRHTGDGVVQLPDTDFAT